jgi:hypothetical protein
MGNKYLKKWSASLAFRKCTDPAIRLLGIYWKESKSEYHEDTSISMFIAALFTIAKSWNQPRYPING